MKKITYLLTISGLALSSAAVAQTEWVADTVKMNTDPAATGYSHDVYYHMGAGEVAKQANNNWDLAFSTVDRMGPFSVFANHFAGVNVYLLDGHTVTDVADFGEDLTADTAGKLTNVYYNSLKTWNHGAFNMNASGAMDAGWGEYKGMSGGEHNVVGDKIFVVTKGSDAYQVWIERYRADGSTGTIGWEVHVAELDGSSKRALSIPLANYQNKLFAYYDLAAAQLSDRLPVSSEWDFVFTRYQEEVAPGMRMPVTGVLSNSGVSIAQVNDLGADTTTEFEEGDFSLDIDVIGRDWKNSNYEGGVYGLNDVFYFVKSKDGKYYQLEFTYATTASGPDGQAEEGAKIGFRKRELELELSVANLNGSKVAEFSVFPNPARGSVNLVLDAVKAEAKGLITVTDVSGKIVFSANRAFEAGLNAYSVDVAAFTPGVYIVNVGGQGWHTAQRVVVQP